MADNDEHHCACKCDDERIGEGHHPEGLHQHEHAKCDHDRGQHLPRAAAQPQQATDKIIDNATDKTAHLRTAPNVIPRNKCLRSKMVKIMTGIRNIVAPAATAGQSLPPTPMIVGMNGGAVWALPEVSNTAAREVVTYPLQLIGRTLLWPEHAVKKMADESQGEPD